jgi:hypothetical protein
LRRVTTALLVVAAMVIAAAVALFVTKDWLVTWGLRVGLAEYNARVHSRLMVHRVGLDLLTLTATAHGSALPSAASQRSKPLSMLITSAPRSCCGH